jgi:hypothetical protein
MTTPNRTTVELRRLDRSGLQLGQPLPGAVRDHRGRIILPAGHVLSATDLADLSTRAPLGIYAGPEWTRPPLANTLMSGEIVDALRRQQIADNKRVRQHQRHNWVTQLTVELEEKSELSVRRREVRVMTCDVSAGGFSFIYRRYVHLGTCVRVRFDSLPSRPRMIGVVRNCRHMNGTTHRVGVEFVDALRHKRSSPEGGWGY